MADIENKEKSLFRSAIDSATSTILSATFPQLNTFIQAMTNRKNKMEGEESLEEGSSSSIKNSLIEEGLNEINSTLQITNIILTSQLEEQTKSNQLLRQPTPPSASGRHRANRSRPLGPREARRRDRLARLGSLDG